MSDKRRTFAGEPDLVLQARRGSPAALTALYGQHGGDLLRLGTRLTGNQADAEDLLHDLFVGLPELLSRYEEQGKLGAWLRGVMTRMALGRLRLASRRSQALERAAIAEPSRSTDPSSAIDAERLIAALPETARVVFVLRHIEDLSHDEIASLLGISTGAVRVRYLRAVRQLRELMESNA